MKTLQHIMVDANEAAAIIAHRLNEVIAIYPITPASPMGEWADVWSAEDRPNLWGSVPTVVEMQSEGGAAGAVHGSLQAGALTTTFTASQGLLLMIPNMYKIAGELTPTVIHVAARTVATHALSIFGDHSDVMAARATGFAMLASGSVQEASDFAAIAHAATLETRIPFVHFFDGFRTSHEVGKILTLSDEELRALIDEDAIAAHRSRALTPDRPVLRGTAQNPDVFFQARERINPVYAEAADRVESVMDRFAEVTGRRYQLFEYVGAPDAERVIVMMCSGAETAHATVTHLVEQGEKVGLVKVRLYRPFDVQRFVDTLPSTVQRIAVLDRTKEPGASGEPLYLDCVNSLNEVVATNGRSMPRIIGGRYGLSSKEFTPGMVKGILDHLNESQLRNHFTIGIEDDVAGTSLPYDPDYSAEPPGLVQAMFYGLGSDGTVGANKNSIKIIGEGTDFHAQGYFVYDSKKSGAVTVSHLRFGPEPIRTTCLIREADFVACHNPTFLERYDMLSTLKPGGIFLLTAPWAPDTVWDNLPLEVQEELIEKKAKLYAIDAGSVAAECGMGNRINTVMQTCFFAISNILPRDEALAAIKKAIEDTYGRKGRELVEMNLRAVELAVESLHEIPVPAKATATTRRPPIVSPEVPDGIRENLSTLMAMKGDDLPVSALPLDGTFPVGTAKWEKRNIALEIPAWDPEVCIQCGKCALVCPHSVIRVKVYEPALIENAPATFKSRSARDRDYEGLNYTIQVAPEDCTGCALCVDVCPAKNKRETRLKALNMVDQPPLREPERENWEFFLTLPERDRRDIKVHQIRHQQIQEPLFEFSGACSGCGETPYLKLLSQLFGDRALIANATGCSSIYGGNLPTTPWTTNEDGRGPAWSNSLFEDNAEFGLGFRLAVDKQRDMAAEMLPGLAGHLGDELVRGILETEQTSEADIHDQRERVASLKDKLRDLDSPDARRLLGVADYLVRKSVWIVGGDGWAYDIGFGGLDHVIASGRDVNILVLDTEVYSNTGGQMSKSTPLGAVAKFAAGGKPTPKKDLARIVMSYGNAYVARVAMGAKDEHTLRAFLEAESFPGPSLIIAYSHCIAHGINMTLGMRHQKAAVDSGQWLLYRHDPRREAEGLNPFQLDSRAPKMALREYMEMENRFRMLRTTRPDAAKVFLKEAQANVNSLWLQMKEMAEQSPFPTDPSKGDGGKGSANDGTTAKERTGKS